MREVHVFKGESAIEDLLKHLVNGGEVDVDVKVGAKEAAKAEVKERIKERPGVATMATVEMLQRTGPLSLMGLELKPVTVECFEFSMPGEDIEMGTLPVELVLRILDMTREELDRTMTLFKKMRR